MPTTPPDPQSRFPTVTTMPWRGWFWMERSTIGLPLALLLLDVIGTWGAAAGGWHTSQDINIRPLDGVGWLLVLAGPVALQHRHRAPRVALFLAVGATLGYLLLGYPNGPVWLNAIVAVISAAAAGYRRAAFVAAFLFAVGMLGIPPHTADQRSWGLVGILSSLLWLLFVTLTPELIRVLRQRGEAADRGRQEEARRQASDERLAIARELHDVLAHSISLIAVQANVALEVMDRRPEQARIALAAIKDASRSALGEVRSVLDVLRGTEAAPRAPAPGLDRLPQLVEQAAAAGLRVRYEVVGGELGEVPRAVSQAGYRIVQESLTNVVRHAGTDRATVLVECGAELRLRISDPGRGVPLGFSSETVGGNGLAGMKERAAAFGGELTARPAPSGGFRVDARIPYPRSGSRAADCELDGLDRAGRPAEPNEQGEKTEPNDQNEPNNPATGTPATAHRERETP